MKRETIKIESIKPLKNALDFLPALAGSSATYRVRIIDGGFFPDFQPALAGSSATADCTPIYGECPKSKSVLSLLSAGLATGFSHFSAIPCLPLIAIALTIMLSGCSNSDKTTSDTKQTESKTTATTTATGEVASGAQLEFFTEKYLPAQERLKRRQNRIKTILGNPA